MFYKTITRMDFIIYLKNAKFKNMKSSINKTNLQLF